MKPSNGSAAQAVRLAGSDTRPPLALLGEELMIYQVAELWAQLDARMRDLNDPGTSGSLRIDCTQLREFDGAGLQLLLVTARHLESLGFSLVLVGLNDKLREQLRGLDPDGLFNLQALEAA